MTVFSFTALLCAVCASALTVVVTLVVIVEEEAAAVGGVFVAELVLTFTVLFLSPQALSESNRTLNIKNEKILFIFLPLSEDQKPGSN